MAPGFAVKQQTAEGDPPRVAYAMPREVAKALGRESEEGLRPVAEFQVVLADRRVRLITPGTLKGLSLFDRALIRARQPYFSFASRVLARGHGLRTVIAPGEDVGLPLALWSFLRRSRVRILIITHGSFLASPKFALLMRLLRRAKRVHFLTLSESIANTLVDEHGVPARRVHNTGYSTDTQFFDPGKSSEPKHQRLVVSCGTANRDYRSLVRATDEIPDISVEIAADSAWIPLRVDIEDDSVPDYLTITKLDYVGLRNLYARAAVVVVPLYAGKHAAGYSAIAEAMAMGKPVIATTTEAPSDFIVDGVTGFYVPPEDAALLRERILLLLENEQLAEQMGRAGRERMMSDFDVRSYANRIARVAGLGELEAKR